MLRSEARSVVTSLVFPWALPRCLAAGLSQTPAFLHFSHLHLNLASTAAEPQRAAPSNPQRSPGPCPGLRSGAITSHCKESCLLRSYLRRVVSHLLGREGHRPDVPHQQSDPSTFYTGFKPCSRIAFIFSEASDTHSWSSIWLGREGDEC